MLMVDFKLALFLLLLAGWLLLALSQGCSTCRGVSTRVSGSQLHRHSMDAVGELGLVCLVHFGSRGWSANAKHIIQDDVQIS